MSLDSAQRDDGLNLQAAVYLLEASGATAINLYGDSRARPPVWAAKARWPNRWGHGAGADPIEALLRLAESGLDGYECAHCGRPTGVDTASANGSTPMAVFESYCWIFYEHDLDRFIRTCGGDL